MAHLIHIATDMGNGASFCSNCRADLTEWLRNDLQYTCCHFVPRCPKCDCEFDEDAEYNSVDGVSDF